MLRHKKINLMQDMPPLMEVERKLFYFTQLGFILLSFTLFSGFMFKQELFSPQTIHKMILSTLSWCIYTILLWGRVKIGVVIRSFY